MIGYFVTKLKKCKNKTEIDKIFDGIKILDEDVKKAILIKEATGNKMGDPVNWKYKSYTYDQIIELFLHKMKDNS